MTDFGIFQALEKKLCQLHPHVTIYGQSVPEMNPPYAVLQLGILEKKLIPQKMASQAIILDLVSRFKGEAEIQEFEQQTRKAFEGMKLKLDKNVLGLIVWEESELRLEKDNITRVAQLKFTLRLKL